MYLPALLSLIHVSIARISCTCVFISFIYSHAFPPVAPPSLPPPPCRVKARQTPPETPPGVSVLWISAFSPSRSLGRRGYPAEGSAAAAAAPAVFDSSPAAPLRLASRAGPRRPLAPDASQGARFCVGRERGRRRPSGVGRQARAKAGAGGGRSAERHSGDGGEARKGENAAQDWAFYVPLDPRYGSMIRPLSKGT